MLVGAKMVTSRRSSTVLMRPAWVRAEARLVRPRSVQVVEGGLGMVSTVSVMWITPFLKVVSCVIDTQLVFSFR